MKGYLQVIVILISAAAFAAVSCSVKEEHKEESHVAEDFGRRQALELSAAIARDTLEAEILILDVRSREAELRRRGAPDVADSYIRSFLHTLDSVNPSLAAELQR